MSYGALAIAAAMPEIVHAQRAPAACAPQWQALQSERQETVRQGATAARQRATYARIDALVACFTGRIETAASARDVSQRQLTAAVRAMLFIDSDITPATLDDAIRNLADQNAELDESLRAATARVTTLEESALRSDALTALERVRTALDEGDIDSAATALAALRTVAMQDYASGEELINEAFHASSALAYSVGDLGAGDQIGGNAITFRRQQRAIQNELHRHADWLVYFTRATVRFERGVLFGSATDVEDAVRIMEQDAAPLVPSVTAESDLSAQTTADWALTQNFLGRLKRELGFVRRDRAVLESALAHYGAVLAIFPRDARTINDRGSVELALSYFALDTHRLDGIIAMLSELLGSVNSPHLQREISLNLGLARVLQGSLQDSDSLVERGINDVQSAIGDPSHPTDPAVLATVQYGIGVSTATLGILRNDTQTILNAIVYLDSTQNYYSYERAPQVWTNAQLIKIGALYALFLYDQRDDSICNLLFGFDELYRVTGQSPEQATAGLSWMFRAQQSAMNAAAALAQPCPTTSTP